jgi:hypothetical protein
MERNFMTNFEIKDLGNGKKQLIVEYNENDTGVLSSTGKSHIIASSNGFKPAGVVKIMFNIIKK